LDRCNFSIEAFFVALDVQLKVAFVCLVIVNVRLQKVVDACDPVLHFFCLTHQVLSERLNRLEAATWSLENSLRHEHVGIAHEVFVLADLGIEQVWENFTRDHFVLFSRERRYWSLRLSAKFPVSWLGIEA